MTGYCGVSSYQRQKARSVTLTTREEDKEMLNARIWPYIVMASLSVVGGVSIIAAQTTTSDTGGSAVNQLLAEVRGLRAEVNQAASASIRAQLLVARLQLQEQRLNVLAGKLSDVRRLISTLQTGQMPAAAEQKRLEDASRSSSFSTEQQQDFQAQLAAMKAQVAQMQAQEEQLRLQETDLSGQLSSERDHWIDFNSRLDELEHEFSQR
jgi:chromosome segregation ATPase